MSEELGAPGAEVIDITSQEGANAQGGAKSITYEDVAIRMGWVPKEHFKGDISKWTDAETWVNETSKRNESWRHEVKTMKQTIDGMAKTFKSSMEAQYKRGLQDAQERRKEAIKAGDVEAVEEIDQHIETLKQQRQNDKPELLPEVESFIGRHSAWWDKDKVMTADALDYKERYLKANPSATISEVLDYVEKKIQRDYPDVFKPAIQQTDTPPAPEGARPAGGAKGDPIAKLKAHIYSDPVSKKVAKQFIEGGMMTEEAYFKSLITLPEYQQFNK